MAGGGVHGQGTCMAGGYVWLGVCRGPCMAGGVCMARGAHGWGMYVAWGRACRAPPGLIPRDTVGQ